MSVASPTDTPPKETGAADDFSILEREFSWGYSGFADRTKAAGPRDFVESALDIDSRSLIRQGIFVLTFVPIAVTLISKLPDIILALNAVFQ